MKKVLSYVIVFVMLLEMIVSIPVFADNTTEIKSYNNRIETLFNNDWQFWRESPKSTRTTISELDTKNITWKNVNLPHDFSIETPFSSIYTTNRSGCLQGGTGWYKKTFTMPSELKDKRVVINFDGVYSYSYIYVNGSMVGSNVMGYVAFAFDITDYLEFGFDKTNEIIVKAVNAVPSERWYSGSGIYRDVTLIITDSVHIDYRGTAVSMPKLASTNGVDGTLFANVVVKNDSKESVTSTVKSTIEKDGVSVGECAEKVVSIAAGSRVTTTLTPSLNKPSLWSVKTPNLYNLKTEILVDNKVVDTYNTTFGYKYTEFSSESGFFLNGEPMKLKGVALHNDLGASLGTKTYDTAVKRYIDLVKDMGCNAIRTAHQPLSQNLMEYCAEIGIMVYDEVYDEWIHQKIGDSGSYTGYFASGIDTTNKLLLTENMGNLDVSGWSSSTTPTWAEFGLKSTMMRDRNNPAVIIWGLGNEIFEGNGVNTNASKAKYPEIGKSLNAWVDEIDPQMRPTCFGDNRNEAGSTGNTRTYLDQVQETMDITGLNYGINWGGYSDLKTLFPNKAMFNTEAVDLCSERGVYDKTNLYKGNGPDDYQFSSYNNDDRVWAEYGYESYDIINNKDWFMGQFLWAGIDYLGEPCDYGGNKQGLRYPNTTYCGSYDSCGFAKDTMYLFRAIWNEDDHTSNMIPSTWNRNEVALDSNGYVPVHIYSNADKIEVILNGKIVGEGTSNIINVSSSDRTNYKQRIWTAKSIDSDNCTTDKIVSGDFTRNYLQFKVKYCEGTLQIKSYSENKDGTYTEITDAKGTQSVTTNNGIEKLEVKQSATEITGNTDSIVYYELIAQTADGDFVNGYNGRVKLTIEGEGELIGTDNGNSRSVIKGASYKAISDDKKTAIVDVYNGKALAVACSTGETGNFTVTASAYSCNDETDDSKIVDTVKTNLVTVFPDTVADEFEEEIEQHTHVYESDESKVVTLPTCIEKGYTTYTCDICKKVSVSDYKPATGHTTINDGSCSVCGWTADQISIVNASEYVVENKACGEYKYTSVSKDEINSKTPYALISEYDSDIRIFTNKLVQFAPNNYFDGNGICSYNVGEIPVKNHTGEHISNFNFHKDLSQFFFDYNENNETLVIASIVDGAKKYLAHLKTGTGVYSSLKWVDSIEDATIFNASYNSENHKFTNIYTTYDQKKYYLGTKYTWYKNQNYVFMLSTNTNTGLEVFKVSENINNSYCSLCYAIISAGEKAKTDASYARSQADNVALALELYKQGVTADKTQSESLSIALTEPIHTCSYSTDGVITKVPTCGESGKISYKCTYGGCPKFKTEVVSKTNEHAYIDHICTVCNSIEPVSVTIDGVTTIYDFHTKYTFPEFIDDKSVAYKDADNNYYLPGEVYGNLEKNITFTTASISFSMLKGASMRMETPNGIRFYSNVDTELIDSLRKKGIDFSMGTLIAPKDILNGNELTKEFGTVDVDYINVKYNSDRWYEEDNFKGMVGSIANIKVSNINRDFIGRGYITIKYGDFEKTVYADYNEGAIENNSRSICYIANKIMLSGDYLLYSSTNQKMIIDYANAYTGLDKYTKLDPDSEDDFE